MHKGLKALRACERTSTGQQKTAGESIHSGKLFTPEAEKENSAVNCASFEPATTANDEGPFKAESVPRESLKTFQ